MNCLGFVPAIHLLKHLLVRLSMDIASTRGLLLLYSQNGPLGQIRTQIMQDPKARKPRVAIIHPDLGIGGAEQLIINVGLALKYKGYDVQVFTPFFDPNRCLDEAKLLDVHVHGSWFPMNINGKAVALCAYIRQLLCTIWVLLLGGHFDYYILDQVSFPIPLVRLKSRNVLFYCHYPDKLLSTERSTVSKKIYRFFLDLFEEITTACARCIVVNSGFTQKVFYDNFPIIRKFVKSHRPEILYPAIEEKTFVQSANYKETIDQLLGKNITKDTVILTSLNRYERKKDIPLALLSFNYYLENQIKQFGQDSVKDVYLVIAGGYDTRLSENVQVHEELVDQAKKLGIEDKVVFLRSISGDQRINLLKNTKILLYTPQNEHFGIVPVEAMHMGCVVIACNSGGPLESVEDGKTGYLVSPKFQEWGNRIILILGSSKEKQDEMRKNAQERVRIMFTKEVFAEQLENILKRM
ncbi:alpha--mannosyltransferase alg2 [Stylonychia lemnae]|uniref:Alpha-1,3/1,6-mannosyltransferase ALG2 n=1 Tax=Stylonychia lemnae TaxID=5949 RepID=A0A078A7J2_STYLE|nr:alpha--mannosyltransferase alg2 [Stylonychia lemnae]|eukprot:CDW77836.1 alpha--mannosyltransferase alg2 [Stylonychia lemnae]